MTCESDQTSNVVGDILVVGGESAARAKMEAPSSTSSSTMANQMIARKEIPLLYEYWKALTVTDKDIAAYHDAIWLPGVLVCNPTTLDFPTIGRTNIICFESHLMCGFGLPPSKFFVSILNYLGCELVHLHLNTITTLSCFSMVCESWLGIPPDTSLFWYFYSPAHYEHKVFSDIGLTLCPMATGKATLEGGFMLTWVTHPNGRTNIFFCH
jgi:hypothetical protein